MTDAVTLATLSSARLTLAPLTVEDADGMLAVYADQRMFTYTGGAALTPTELHRRYERLVVGWNHDRSEQWGNWIVRVKGDSHPIGAMQATIACDRAWAAVAWEVAVEQQGKGYASEAAVVVVDWLLRLGISRITAAIHPDHAASAAVARSADLLPTDEVDDGEVVWERLASSF